MVEFLTAAERSASFSTPRREQGAITKDRSTGAGRPFSSRNETSASPTPNSVITSAVLNAGLGRMVSAAVLTAF